jgi:hypothetical protein
VSPDPNDTIVGMLKGELERLPAGGWTAAQRAHHREYLLGKIRERECLLAERQRKAHRHALALRMLERLLWMFGYVVMAQMGVNLPIPGVN